MGLYDYIPDNRWITREELVRITGFSDRKVRDGISELRKDPKTMVVSSSHGKGYKRPSNVEEMKTCLNEINSRVKDLELQKRAILKAISDMETETDAFGQIFLRFD